MARVEDICQGIPKKRLDSPVTDIQIADLASELKTWEELAPYLGLTQADEEEFQVDYRGRYGLQKRQALRKWQSKVGRGPNGATYRNFIIALCRAKEIEMAEKVRNLLIEPEESATAAEHVLETFHKYLVDCYTIAQHPAQTQWPFSRLSSYIDLTLVHAPDTQTPPSGQEERAQPLKEVQLTELFNVGSHQASRKVVLIEGPAGCGKTTLSWHVCREWAAGRLFQQFSLLIHISLEDDSLLSAKCLADIIPHGSSELREAVAKGIYEQDGKGVCFLFDAWDEAPRALQGRNSFLFKFISGSSVRMLPRCSIVVTSRPVVAGLDPYFTARVNIRGFGATKLKEFIDVSLQNCTSKQIKLLEALQEKPQVNDLCNLPINATIVVHLFQSSSSTLPATRTGIFMALVCNLLLRYMQLRTDHRLEEVQELTNFEQLPDDILQHFKSVCGLAFHGIMEGRKVFLLDSLQKLGLKHPSSPLGLMQAQQQLTGFGACHCYSFLHYAVQEFLAAYHISKLSEEEQTKSVGQILHSTPLSTVLPFYAGLTHLSNGGVCDILLQVTKQPLDTHAVMLALSHTLHESSDRRRLLLALLHCIYEAQKPSICKLVNPPLHPECRDYFAYGGMLLNNELGYTSGRYTQVGMSCCISFHFLGLDVVDCLAVGYFIFNKCLLSNMLVNVDLTYCNLGDTEVKVLMKKIRKVPSNKQGVEIVLSYNTVGHEAITAISNILIQSSTLRNIVLKGCLHPATTDTKSALKYLIEGVSRNTSLVSLTISNCSLGPEHAYHLALLAAVCNTGDLSLPNNNIRCAIPFIAEAIKYNRAIDILDLAGCHISDRELILLGGTLQQHDRFSILFISKNPFSLRALSEFLSGLIGTDSGLCLLVVDRQLTNKQICIIGIINAIRLQISLPPLQVTDMAFAEMTIRKAANSALSVPPDVLNRFAYRENTN